MPAIQDNRRVVITSALGANVLLFHRMRGMDGLGSLGEYHLDLLSEKSDIKADDILGKDLSIALDRPDGEQREFNGLVTRFTMTGRQGRYATYQATVRPWLWFLTRAADCCIFQDKTAVEIIKAIFDKYMVADFDFSALTATYPKLPYCVQYRESDFNFVSRLMERFGIYYYFKHDSGRHTMVLADSYSAHSTIPGYAELAYVPDDEAAMRNGEVVYKWLMGGEIQTDAYSLKAFDFEKPAGNLLVKSKIMRTHDQNNHEVYDYPGQFVERADGETSAQVNVEALQSNYETVSASTTARGVFPGGMFKLTEHSRADQNAEFLVVSAEYELASDAYQSLPAGEKALFLDCRFTAIGKDHAYRSGMRTRKPVIQGPQTAIVVGKAGEEIWTDKYGRIKVQFHWDRIGKDDETSSCWVRVSQAWAGKRWGHLFIPRIGQEVIVSFLEGDPDQPLVTGSVYNADTMPPYKLPDQASRSTIMSNSTKGGEGYNEIRFDDKKGSEQLFLHAEKNQDNYIKNDLLEWIGNNRHLMVEKDEMEQVGGDKSLTVKGDLNEKVTGTTSMDAGQDLQSKAGMKYGLEAGTDIHIKAGMNVVIEAGMSITLKAGGGFIVIGPASVAISGTPILLNSGGSAGSGAGAAPKAPTAPDKADDGSK
ncbi:type VI secretion system Vgr family protein [Undibacterium sp. TJN25]|uniref:type VI secretion system Vgr family protein n=1 Tax=Undibacterium sp. TJN25 TaxID=3413056 RepID=UPI003BEF9CBD